MESGNSRPDQQSRMPSPAARPTWTRSSPPSSKCAAGSLPWVRRRSIRRKQRVPLSRRKVLHGLAYGDAGGSVATREQPCVHALGLLLAGLPEHPADRLANEEFPFVEHSVRIAAEPFKVSCAATQLGKQRQERRAANPEVVIDRPSVEDVEQPRRAFHQWARDRDGQFVDEGPRLRLPDQALEQRDAAPTEERFEGIEKEDGHHSPLE